MTKTIQITLDDSLLQDVDLAVRELGTTRSAFICTALQSALRELEIRRLEAQHARGYGKMALKPDEFGDWQDEQVWGSD